MAIFFDWFTKVVFYLISVPILIGLYRWPSLIVPIRLFWCNLLVGLAITLANDLLPHQSDNFGIYYTNTAIDAVLMTGCFTAWLSERLRWLFWVGCGAFLLLMGWGTVQWGFTLTTALRFSTIESSFVILMAVCVGVAQIRRPTQVRLRQEPIVWITVGVLIMNLMTLVLNVLGSQLYVYSADLFNIFWNTVVPLSQLTNYIFAGIGFWLSRSPVSRTA
ncbi:hypothetical protein [Fibrella arboris]|uniref:hypothetical protein n=1 Tax=Fibrella arboris TaxID=3242486 RepID=UPI003522EEA8